MPRWYSLPCLNASRFYPRGPLNESHQKNSSAWCVLSTAHDSSRAPSWSYRYSVGRGGNKATLHNGESGWQQNTRAGSCLEADPVPWPWRRRVQVGSVQPHPPSCGAEMGLETRYNIQILRADERSGECAETVLCLVSSCPITRNAQSTPKLQL